MRIPTNKISSIIKFFKEELKDIYNADEIENFIFYSFSEDLGFSRSDLLLKTEETVSESMLLKFNNVVKQLKKHKPIQYILGSSHFYGLKFHIDGNVLIPRQETEELVDLIIKSNKNKQGKILDIGTGSGCIAIALKKNLPQYDVSAIDISEKALEVAKRNAGINNAEINFIEADIFNNLVIQHFNNLDIIVSNPPYVLLSEKDKMEKNVLDHEPHLALFVNNDDPLKYYKIIADFALKTLNPDGQLFFEINETMGLEAKKLLEDKGFKNVNLKQDISAKNRILYGNK